MKDKIVFDCKKDMEIWLKSNPRILTKEEINKLYNDGKPISYNFKEAKEDE